MSILVEINDSWQEIDVQNGVDIIRFEKNIFNAYRRYTKSIEKKILDNKDEYYDVLQSSSVKWHEGENDDTAFTK